MNAYLQWNDAIATRFFNQDMAGRNVYMYVNQGLISEMEQELEPEAGKFLDAIKDGRLGLIAKAYASVPSRHIRIGGIGVYIFRRTLHI